MQFWIDIYIFVNNMTIHIWYIMFAPLFCQERQPVSSVFHIPTGFMHSSARDGGQHGFSTDRETIYATQVYWLFATVWRSC